ncbi:MAG: type II toxin-antitoxin system PrlF family antitoxin [Deltaproteobacteria bacterium]|nr:type II toxin-antitoxin system PrlF family antitoxin [Deltaproteobacteria bacterium]
MITSRLTAKAQTTIPQPVRSALNLKPGGELSYQIQGKRMILAKARRKRSGDDPFKAFYEWDSEADRRAYADL